MVARAGLRRWEAAECWRLHRPLGRGLGIRESASCRPKDRGRSVFRCRGVLGPTAAFGPTASPFDTQDTPAIGSHNPSAATRGG